MKIQSATTQCPQQRDGVVVSSCPDVRVQLSSPDLLPRARFDWCLGPHTIALLEALFAERACARAGSNASAISAKRSILGAVTQRGPSDTLSEGTFELEDAGLSGVSATFRGERMSLGQTLLTGFEWRGHLDLLDPEARARFDRYVDGASCPTAGEVEA